MFLFTSIMATVRKWVGLDGPKERRLPTIYPNAIFFPSDYSQAEIEEYVKEYEKNVAELKQAEKLKRVDSWVVHTWTDAEIEEKRRQRKERTEGICEIISILSILSGVDPMRVITHLGLGISLLDERHLRVIGVRVDMSGWEKKPIHERLKSFIKQYNKIWQKQED